MTKEDLKNSILQMAIEGKLVKQNKNDEPAKILLEKIKAEKEKLIKEKKIKKDKNETIIYRKGDSFFEKNQKDEEICIDDQIPFDIPDNWEWVRLNNLFYVENGDRSKNYPSNTDLKNFGVPFIGAKDMIDGFISFNNIRYISSNKFNSLRSGKLQNMDFICLLRGSVGKTALFKTNDIYKTGFICAQMVIIRSFILDIVKYFHNFFCSQFYLENIKNKITGTSVKQLPAKELSKIIIPLPPLEEQKRIVEKIEKILPLVEEYGENYEKLQKINEEFPKELKDSILQHAIEGKLVKQNKNDEPASLLLEKIKAEKEKLIKEKKIKKDKNETIIYRKGDSFFEKNQKGEEICIDDEIPFDIPDNWEWSRLGNVYFIEMGQSPKGNSVLQKDLSTEGIEFHQGKVFFSDKFLNFSDKVTISPNKIAPKNSVLLCVRAPVGKVNITDRDICIGRGLCSIHPIFINVNYLFYSLITFEEIFNKKATGTTFKAITKETVINQLIPIPPLEEQKRIVEKIEQILNIIEKI